MIGLTRRVFHFYVSLPTCILGLRFAGSTHYVYYIYIMGTYLCIFYTNLQFIYLFMSCLAFLHWLRQFCIIFGHSDYDQLIERRDTYTSNEEGNSGEDERVFVR